MLEGCSCHINPPCSYCVECVECPACSKIVHRDELETNLAGKEICAVCNGGE